MSQTFEILSVNISEKKGTIKTPTSEIVLDERGVAGDAHAGPWHRQVSILSHELVTGFSKDHGRAIAHGEFAENLTTQGLDLRDLAPLDRIHINDAVLEITQIGKSCHGDACAIFREVGACVMPKEGLFARVIQGGTVRAGDKAEYHPRPLKVHIITLSDRAAAGEYEDRSGPRIETLLQETIGSGRWHLTTSRQIIPDEAERLRQELCTARDAGVDVIFTTGSTGIGPRDIAPDVIAPLCGKLIPGIMEGVRIKFGLDKPAALLSRSVAGVMGATLVFALPGSVKAVQEYTGEITKVLEHLLYTLHGIDRH